jgi:hypothetical protein
MSEQFPPRGRRDQYLRSEVFPKCDFRQMWTAYLPTLYTLAVVEAADFVFTLYPTSTLFFEGIELRMRRASASAGWDWRRARDTSFQVVTKPELFAFSAKIKEEGFEL